MPWLYNNFKILYALSSQIDYLGINITQWQLLLNLNPKALEGLSSNTVKCLNEQQVKVSMKIDQYFN